MESSSSNFSRLDVNSTSEASSRHPINDSGAKMPLAGALVGELAGLKITTASEHAKDFSPIESDILEAASLREGDHTPLHPFVQVHPSSSSLATDPTPTIDPSPPLNHEKMLDLRGIAAQCLFLQEKIKTAEEVTYPPSQKGYYDFNECQQRHVKNLDHILEAIADDSLIHDQKDQNVITKIEPAVNKLIEVAEQLKKYTEEIITDRVAQKERPFNGAAGELEESFEHYLDYIDALKTGDVQRAPFDCCLAKKCLSKFKSLEAEEQGNQKEGALFGKAAFCYEEALEKKSFDNESFEEAGNCFHAAATMLHNEKQGLAEPYERAGTCFEKAHQPCKSQVPAEISSHAQAAAYWILSGNNILNAIDALQAGKTALFSFYNIAGECFQHVAEKFPLTDHDPEVRNEIKALDQAGNHFASAAEATEQKQPLVAALCNLAGLCSRNKADAISKKDNEALNYFEKGENVLCTSLFSSVQDRSIQSEKTDQSHCKLLGKSYYLAGKALLMGEKKAAELYARAALCREEQPSNPAAQDALSLLKKAATYYTTAGSELQKGNGEAAKLYELAGDCNDKAARANHPDALDQWKRAGVCYSSMISEQKKNSQAHNSALQLFNAAAQYSRVAAQEIEKYPHQKKSIRTLLDEVSANLFLAAEAIQNRDQELSNAYENRAAAQHHLLIAKNPALLEKFPSQFQEGFKKESKINLGLIKYWFKATMSNHEKIAHLLAVRDAGSSEAEEVVSKKARAI